MNEPLLSAASRPRHPEWIRVRAPYGENYGHLKGLMHGLALHTVCEEAFCPNIGECWGAGTATIMILGDTCTRTCRFCAVKTGNPRGILDKDEPARAADAIAELRLNYIVVTSVDRDDLPDGGAEIFAETVRQIKTKSPPTLVEILTPDFRGVMDNLRTVVEAKPDVFGQNIETVRRLTHVLRDRRGVRSNIECSARSQRDRSGHAHQIVDPRRHGRDSDRGTRDHARPARRASGPVGHRSIPAAYSSQAAPPSCRIRSP